ncbi:MAG: sulfurtransferase TusA family protein [Bacillota bacterium]
MEAVVDVRGLMCPEPVLITRRELERLQKGRVRVIADAAAARDNITRLAQHAGWRVTVTAEGNAWVLLLEKE